MSSGNLLASGPMTPEKAKKFLEGAAVYFERRPTGGEDSAYWANVHNAEWCRKIAAYIESNPIHSLPSPTQSKAPH